MRMTSDLTKWEAKNCKGKLQDDNVQDTQMESGDCNAQELYVNAIDYDKEIQI